MPTPTNENSDGQGFDSQSSHRHGYSESRLKVLRAYENRWEESGSLPFTTVAMEGMGPFSRGKIWSYLWDLGAEVSEIEDAPLRTSSSSAARDLATNRCAGFSDAAKGSASGFALRRCFWPGR